MATYRKRIGKKGVRWSAIVRKDGQVQSATFRTKSEAQTWAAAIETEIEKGNRLPTSEAKRRTVKDLLDRYKEYEIPKKADKRNPSRIADVWITDLGNLKLQRLTPAIIVEFRDKLAKDRAGSTVNRYLALLSHACTIAEREWGWMESNPVRKVSRLKESQGRVRYLSDNERAALLKATKASVHPYLHCAVLIAISTGARKSEILGLGWSDVDLTQGTALLSNTKNNERRRLALVPVVIQALRELQKVRQIGVDAVFIDPSTGKPARNKFEQAWRAARQSAGIEDFRFHDLRHTAASYLAMNGATTAEIAAVLGHKTLQMVKRYSHLSDQHVRNVVEATAEKMLGDI